MARPTVSLVTMYGIRVLHPYTEPNLSAKLKDPIDTIEAQRSFVPRLKYVRHLVKPVAIKPERLSAIPRTKDRGRHNGLHVDDACGRSPGNQCDRRAERPHARSQGRVDELTRVRARGARGSTGQGSFRSLQSHVPRCGRHERAANDRGRDNRRDRDVERLYGHSLGYACANLRR